MPEPLRVPISELKVNPSAYLESARSRRVLLTNRGRVVGEITAVDEPAPAPLKPLLGALSHLIQPDPQADLTAPVEAEWKALE